MTLLSTQSQKGDAFFALHHRNTPFVIPNPWDIGSAKILARKGFEALATTSVGVDHMNGKPAGTAGRTDILANAKLIADATPLPVSIDMEDCYATTPEGITETIQLAAQTGAVGCSIEDMRFSTTEIYGFDEALARVKAAVAAAAALPFKFTLTARCENFLCDKPDMDDTIMRLKAFENAGADVLYAPGLTTTDQVKILVDSLDKPLNVLLGISGIEMTMADMKNLGVGRVSLGSGLQRAAFTATLNAIEEIQSKGTFSFTNANAGMDVIDDLMR